MEGARPDLRRRILDAARKLFVHDGYEAASMRAIAKRIGYSPTMIYHHFGGKEELLREVCHRDFRALSTALFLHIALVEDPIERLRRIGRSYLDFALRHPRQYAFLFMSGRPVSGRLSEADGNPVDDGYVLVLATVAEASALGRFRPGFEDPDRVAQLLWCSVHGLAALHVAGPNHTWLELCDILTLSEDAIEVTLRGLLR